MPDKATTSAWATNDRESSREVCCKTRNCYQAIVIITSFLQRLRSRFLLLESNLHLELSQFLVHSLLRKGNGAHWLRELHMDVEG